MRVALVGPYPVDPSRIGGGVETAFAGFVSGLVSLRDVEAHVLTFDSALERRRTAEIDGVVVHRLPATRRGGRTLHFGDRRTVRTALAALRPDVIHAQDTLRHGYVSLKSGLPTPVVLNVHGILRNELAYAGGTQRLRLRVVGLALERYCIRHGRYFVQSTPYPEQVLGRETRGTFADIRNPIAERFFSVTRDPDAGRIVYSGSVIPRKRLLDLIDAMPAVVAAVPETRLRVAGHEPDAEYARRARERVRELDLAERVDFLGGLAPPDLLDEYRRASVFVLPSGQETSPLSIGEAMAVGLPVVATNTGGVRFLVEEGVTGYVVAIGDVPALADRLRRVLVDAAEQMRLGLAAQSVAERDFRPRRSAERLRDFYQRAIEESARA